MFTVNLCALMCNNLRLITHSLNLAKMMTIGDELQPAVLSMQDDDQDRHV